MAKLLKEALNDEATEQSESLANHFISVGEGGLLLGKANQDMAVAEASILHFKNYVHRLIGR